MAMRYYAPFPGDGSDPLRPRGPHTLRIGDAERDAAAADLGEHYAAGRLTLDELNERLDATFSAKTFGQLVKVMTDLPGPGRLAWHLPIAMGSGPWRGPEESATRFHSGQLPEPPTPTDRAGRLAALSLLLLAMLLWLFTALLFARHGFYHSTPYEPGGPWGHFGQHATVMPMVQGMNATGP